MFISKSKINLAIVATLGFFALYLVGFLPTPENTSNIKLSFDEEKACRHIITLETALNYISEFQRSQECVNKDNYCFQNLFKGNDLFSKSAIISLLKAPDAEGIRVYFGLNG